MRARISERTWFDVRDIRTGSRVLGHASWVTRRRAASLQAFLAVRRPSEQAAQFVSLRCLIRWRSSGWAAGNQISVAVHHRADAEIPLTGPGRRFGVRGPAVTPEEMSCPSM